MVGTADQPPKEREVIDAEFINPHRALPSSLPCPACGAPSAPGERYCSACGSSLPQESPAVADHAAAPLKQIRCDACGAELAVQAQSRSTTCPFCDSTYVVDLPETSQRQSPEFIIGFAVTRAEAEEYFRRWLGRGGLFTPGDLRQVAVADKVRGVYVPFWSFAARAHSRWQARIGEYWYKTETYVTRNAKGRMVTRTRRVRHTEWWPLAGEHHQYYSAYLIPAGGGLTQEEADQIQPFGLPALTRYQPFYLAGWLTEQYTLAADEAWQRCEEYFRGLEYRNIAAFLPGDTYTALSAETSLEKTSTELILLPIHIFSYRYGDRVYRFVINGQTGRASGQKPVSKKRIAIAFGIGVAIVAVIVAIALIIAGASG